MNGSKVSCVKDTEAMVDAALHSFRFLRPPNSAVIIPRQSGDISRKGETLTSVFLTWFKDLWIQVFSNLHRPPLTLTTNKDV